VWVLRRKGGGYFFFAYLLYEKTSVIEYGKTTLEQRVKKRRVHDRNENKHCVVRAMGFLVGSERRVPCND
jgi:hypothetical protein